MKRLLSGSIKNVAKVSLGALLGQLISIVSLPFITRIYGADTIGLWTIINACSCILVTVGDLGLQNVLMMCNETEVKKSYSVVTVISIAISIAGCPVVFIYSYFQAGELNSSVLSTLFVLFYAIALVQTNMLAVLLNREKRYDVIMINSLVRFGGVATLSILFGMLGLRRYGYFLANMLGQAFTVFYMYYHLDNLFTKVEYHDSIKFIKENINYVKYQMPAGITATLRTELPNLLIGALFGNKMLGYFSVSQKLLTIPITFLGQSIGKVFYQKAAEMKRMCQPINKFVERNINRGMLLAAMPMILFAAVGDVAIVLYFGAEYAIGGVICRIIAFRSLFNFISTSVQGIDIVLDRQHYVFFACASQTFLSVIAVFVGYYLFESIYAVSVLLVVGFSIVQIVYFYKIYQAMELNPRTFVFRIVVLLLSMIGIAYLIRNISIYLLQTIDVPLFKLLLDCFVFL